MFPLLHILCQNLRVEGMLLASESSIGMHRDSDGGNKKTKRKKKKKKEEDCGDKGMQEQIGIGGDETLLHVYGFLFPSLLR